MKNNSCFKSFIIAFLAIAVFSNCTIIGLATGSSIASKKHKKRPLYPTDALVFDSISYDTWLDVFKKDGELIEGKFVKTESNMSESGIEQKLVILNVMGQKKHTEVFLEDIDHVVVGYKSDGPTVLGMGIGMLADLSFLSLLIYSIFPTGD